MNMTDVIEEEVAKDKVEGYICTEDHTLDAKPCERFSVPTPQPTPTIDKLKAESREEVRDELRRIVTDFWDNKIPFGEAINSLDSLIFGKVVETVRREAAERAASIVRSKKNRIKKGWTTEEMLEDAAQAILASLSITKETNQE